MKVESLFLLFLGAFFGIVGLVYWFWSYEDGGGVMLLGATLLGFLPGLYYFFWHKRFHGRKYFFWGKVPAAGRPAVRPRGRGVGRRCRHRRLVPRARPSGPSCWAWVPS